MMKELTRGAYLEKVLGGYERYYDIRRIDDASREPLRATAFFHARSSAYVLVKSAEMWSAECNEYIYFFSMPRLTGSLAKACIEAAYEDGYPRIKPDGDHMSSSIDAVLICDHCDDDALRLIKKYRKRKSFQFALHGWMEVHVAAVVLGAGTVTANIANVDTVKYLKIVLAGRKSGTAIGRGLRTFLRILKD